MSLGLSVTLLINVPFFGNVDLRRALHSHRQATAADSLPPLWRHPSRLALENEFVTGELPRLGGRSAPIHFTNDPRELHVTVDPDSGTVVVAPELGDVPVGPAGELVFSQYGRRMTERSFYNQWNRASIDHINDLNGTVRTGSGAVPGGFSFQLPSPLPRRVQSILGPGGPALNVRGSENIRISGTSNWTNQQVGPLGQRKSLFPSLDMQQDLDIQLEGQLSDRIRVNLLQNSANQIPLSNRIAINYRGEEDALFQQIDLGNTNLSLPGTQYVSYSGKNEGLFGMKATSRLGPLDFTLLASKQEGRSERASYAGGASKQVQTIRDLEYVRGVYFLLGDPNRGPFEIPDASIRVYRDDNVSSNDVNVVRGVALPEPGTIDVALNPPAPDIRNNPLIPDSTSLGTGPVAVRGQFDLLNRGADRDYEILSDIYGTGFKVLRVTQPLLSSQRLAVTYQRRHVDDAGAGVGAFEDYGGLRVLDRDGDSSLVMKLIRLPSDLLGRTGSGLDAVFDPGAALYALRELELRNFYQLAGQRIDPATFKLTIRKDRDEPPKTTVLVSGVSVPYIEVLGLDNFDESSGTPVRGHDNRIDGTLVRSTVRLFVDYENGTLFFLEPRPFAPRLDGSKPFDDYINLLLTRRTTLTGAVGSDTQPNPAIYDKYNVQTDTDAHYYMDVEFNAARASGEISLGRGNLLEGTEVVTINGSALQRGRDYDIDYDLGRMTLKRQLGPADQLNIDYSYAPLFQQAGRTLIGSAFTMQGRDRSLGGAFMYESRGAQDLRPRLGEEPARSVIGDLNSDWAFHPGWITRMVDRLPGVRTTAPSEFRIQGEVGASFPNPNTRNEVYIDDMEGVRDAVSLTLDPSRWRWSSVPTRAEQVVNGQAVLKTTMLELEDQHRHQKNAELHWYSPYSYVKERDLKPTLSDAQGAQNNRQVLALSVPRRPLTSDSNPATLDTLWAGLTYSLDQVGVDLTKSQFLELWVNDFNDHHDPGTASPRVRGRHVRLHLDLGKVSEDQMRSPDERPDAVLNSEDKLPRDNSLDVTDKNNEDTGLDTRLSKDEAAALHPAAVVQAAGEYRDLVTSSGDDPQGDDFHQPEDSKKIEGQLAIDASQYLRINGTEGDKNVSPYPETEDLNLNGNLDRDENYFEYTIDLGDDSSPYLVTDLQALKAAGEPGYATINGDNGWRRYRIPINDSLRVQFGIPDLSIAQHVRVWLDGMTLPDMPADSTSIAAGKHVERPLLLLGSVDIVGSRWRAAVLDSADALEGATLTLNAVNSVDNADVYTPPFDPGETRNGNQALTRREQSMALEFTHLSGGRTVEAFKTFSLDENYSRYGKLNWFVTGFDVRDSLDAITNDSLYYFVRFSSDELGRAYYEYRAPLPVSPVSRGKAWQEVRLQLSELSAIKLDPAFPLTRDTLFAVARSPGSPDTLVVKGRPSFTRLRRVSFGVVNKRSTGYYRQGQLWFDELRAIDVAKDKGHAQRVQVNGRLSNLASYSMGWNGRDEDFLSVGESRGSGTANDNYNFSGSLDLHRFFEATGIILPLGYSFTQNTSKPRFSAGDDIVRGGRDLERSESFSDNRSWNVSYSRTWSDRAYPLLRYTLGGVTANYSANNNHARNPAGGERSSTSAGGVNYNVALRQALPINLPAVKPMFYPLPERAYVNYRFDQRQSSTSDRPPGTDDLIARTIVKGSSGAIQMGADTRPFDFMHHHIEAQRNLTLPYRPLGIKLNVGRVVNWNQSSDASYAPRFVPWIRPQFNWSSTYGQANGPELSSDLSVRAIQNGEQGGMRWELPFGSLAQRNPSPGDTTHRGPALWRRAAGRLGNATAELSASRSSSYSRLIGMPGFFYLFGLSDDPHVGDPSDPNGNARMRAAPGNQGSKSFQWRATGRTQIALFWKMTAQTAGEFFSQTTDANGATRGQDQLRLPDVTFEFGNMPSLIHIDKVIRNPRLRSSVNRQVTTEFNNGRSEKSSITTLIQFRPLLGLSGELPNGMRLELNTEHRHSDRELLQLGNSLQQDINTDADLSLTRSYSQGQKLSFLGRETTVRSSITIGLTGRYERQTGRIVQSGSERNPVSRDRISVNANGSYGFSSTVSGNATLGFSQDKDKVRDSVHRSVRVEIAARFSL